MKAEMTSDGIITLYPETTLEAFALKHWKNASTVNVCDVQRCENTYWLGSKLVVSGNILFKDDRA